MNRCYRVIFNHATGVWQCVSEFARAKGKTKSVKALSVAVGLAMSGQVLAADIVFDDGQPHHIANSAYIDGDVLISNTGTKFTSDSQILFGSAVKPTTTVEISNQALLQSPNEMVISHNKPPL